MYHNFTFIYIIGILLINSKFATSHCSYQINEAVQNCVQPIAHYAKVLNQEDEQNSSNTAKSNFGQAIALPKIGRYVFRELCRLVRNFNECVYKFRQQCPEHVTISLIDASYGFLCNEGYETFMQSAECLVELDRQPTVKHCHEITLKHIEAANAQVDIALSNRFDKMCQALNYFASCVEQSIAYGCGAEAWTMIFRVLRDTTNTLLPRCQFTGRSALIQHSASVTVPVTTTTTATVEVLNEKAKIIWFNDDMITSSNSLINNADNGEELSLKTDRNIDPRRSSSNSHDQRSKGEITGHILMDADTDISYYDENNDNFAEITDSSSSFLASNSANHSYLIIVIFLQYLSLCWIIFKFY